MQFPPFRAARIAVLCGLAWAAACAESLWAQSGQLGRGFETNVNPSVRGEELNRQADLWVMEVDYKPLRMIWVDLTDPQTGTKKRELVWYLVYRAVNRDLGRQIDDSDTTPVNDEDAEPPSYFVPEFTLMTADNTGAHIYQDEILPEAQVAIMRRERARLLNSVEVVAPVSPPVRKGDPNEEQHAIYGLAMWRNIDPRTDYFTIFMSGFSNGYERIAGPGGEMMVRRRTIRQEYWRPGDEFFQREEEVRSKGEPAWIYRDDDLPAEVPAADAAAPAAGGNAPAP